MSKFVWRLTLDLSSMVEPAGGMNAPAGIAGTAPGGPKGTQATTPTARYRHHGRKIPQVNVSGVIFVDFLFHSRSCCEGSLPGSQVSHPPQNPTLLNSNSMSRGNSGRIVQLQTISLSCLGNTSAYSSLPNPHQPPLPPPPLFFATLCRLKLHSLTCPVLRKCSL